MEKLTGIVLAGERGTLRIAADPGSSFLDRMISMVEGAKRQKTPNEIALNILLAALTIIFVFAVATLQPLAIYSKMNNPGVADSPALDGNGVTGNTPAGADLYVFETGSNTELVDVYVAPGSPYAQGRPIGQRPPVR